MSKENKIQLFKQNKGRFTDLYLRINDGSMIQIKMSFFNIKIWNMLLAVAENLPQKEEK